MRKTLSITLLAVAAAAVLAPPALAQVAKVNGITIPQGRADILMREIKSQGREDSPELREMVKQELINREVMAQEAVKLGLNKKKEVSAQLDIARQNVLVGAFLNEMARRHPASEEALRQAHERFKDSPAANEFKARHILLSSETEAKNVIEQLKGGADFAKLASQQSLDEGSKANGGELQWAAPTTYVRPFAEALARLKKGEMTETPVRTNFGWHVIKLDDMRPMTFEAIKPQLTQVVQRENVQKAVQELRAKAKVE